jgi:hypothetical protein
MNARSTPAYPAGQNSLQSELDMHLQLAKEQAAMHCTRLAVARCCCDVGPGGMPAGQPLTSMRWHEQTQRNFCAWLAAGGFAQDTATETADTNENSGLRRRSHVPLRDSCEESKFSLIRISDAVE